VYLIRRPARTGRLKEVAIIRLNDPFFYFFSVERLRVVVRVWCNDDVDVLSWVMK